MTRVTQCGTHAPISRIFFIYAIVVVKVKQVHFFGSYLIQKHERPPDVHATVVAERMPQGLSQFRITGKLWKTGCEFSHDIGIFPIYTASCSHKGWGKSEQVFLALAHRLKTFNKSSGFFD